MGGIIKEEKEKYKSRFLEEEKLIKNPLCLHRPLF